MKEKRQRWVNIVTLDAQGRDSQTDEYESAAAAKSLSLLGRLYSERGTCFTANTAAAASFAKSAHHSRVAAVQMANMPQQRQLPSLSPHVRHNGSCSRVCRRYEWRKMRTPVALPVFAAAQFGDNFANPALDRHYA